MQIVEYFYHSKIFFSWPHVSLGCNFLCAMLGSRLAIVSKLELSIMELCVCMLYVRWALYRNHISVLGKLKISINSLCYQNL